MSRSAPPIPRRIQEESGLSLGRIRRGVTRRFWAKGVALDRWKAKSTGLPCSDPVGGDGPDSPIIPLGGGKLVADVGDRLHGETVVRKQAPAPPDAPRSAQGFCHPMPPAEREPVRAPPAARRRGWPQPPPPPPVGARQKRHSPGTSAVRPPIAPARQRPAQPVLLMVALIIPKDSSFH